MGAGGRVGAVGRNRRAGQRVAGACLLPQRPGRSPQLSCRSQPSHACSGELASCTSDLEAKVAELEAQGRRLEEQAGAGRWGGLAVGAGRKDLVRTVCSNAIRLASMRLDAALG